MDRKQEILGIFPKYLRNLWLEAAAHVEEIQEIRLRCNQPVILMLRNKECFLSEEGKIHFCAEHAHRTDYRELESIMNHVCNYSLYAYEKEIRAGYLTIPGGHRLGVAGQVIWENHEVKNIRNISCINIRISHEIKGAADAVLPYLYREGEFCNGMVISPPGCGKTTMLRDIVRQVSGGSQYAAGMTVGVVDERSEIAGSYRGIAQNDLGPRTDVLDGCPKAVGMMMLIRSMSPRVIAVDELGSKEDMAALQEVICSGSKMIVTIHGNSLTDIQNKVFLKDMMNMGIFERFIVLEKKNNRCQIQGIYNQDCELCLK